MRRPNFSLPKIGIPIFLVFILVVAATYIVTSKWNLDPEVIQAKAAYAANSVESVAARTELMKAWPDVLTSAQWFTLALLGGIAGLSVVLSFSYSLVVWSTGNFLVNGVEYEKVQNGVTTSVKLFQPNTRPRQLNPGNVRVDNPRNDRQLPKGHPQNDRNNLNRKLSPGESQATRNMDRRGMMPEQRPSFPPPTGVREPPRTDPLAEDILGR